MELAKARLYSHASIAKKKNICTQLSSSNVLDLQCTKLRLNWISSGIQKDKIDLTAQ